MLRRSSAAGLATLLATWLAVSTAVTMAAANAAAATPLISVHASLALVEEVVNVTRALVDIDSVSGNEKAAGDYVAAFLAAENYTVERQVLEPGKRENIFAYRPGARNARLVINSHIDTVPPFFPSSEDDTTIYGRGVVDAKGQIAPQILAVRNLRARGQLKETDVSRVLRIIKRHSFLYVVGEEVDHSGMKFANELRLTPEFLLVGEPTESKLAIGHKGGFKFYLEYQGLAAHSGYPELGIPAISRLMAVLTDLEATAWPVDPILGPTTLNVGLISGGVAANVVPEYARAEIMIRVATSVAEVEALVRSVVGNRANLTLVSANDPVFCATLPGFPTIAVSYNTDIPYLSGDQIPYLMGPGSITVAHRPDERMDKQELGDHVLLYEELITAILRQAPGEARVPRR